MKDTIHRKEVRYEATAPFTMTLNYVETNRSSPVNQFDSHVHPECEIYINLSGDVSFVVENQIYPIFPGNVIITRPYEYHHCVYHSDAEHKHFWILFSSNGNEALLGRFFDRKAGENNLLLLSSEHQQELISLCHGLIKRSGTYLSQYSGFVRILELLDSADVPADALEKQPNALTQVLDYINQHFAEPIAIRDLADAAYVSLHTLERYFHEAMGMTPSAYLKKKRLAYAAELLYKGRNVMETSQESGFSDYSTFIATFRRHYGMTPLQYQKHVKNT